MILAVKILIFERSKVLLIQKKMFLVPNGRNYLDLNAKDKFLYFTSLNQETRKIEKKIGPKNSIFFR